MDGVYNMTYLKKLETIKEEDSSDFIDVEEIEDTIEESSNIETLDTNINENENNDNDINDTSDDDDNQDSDDDDDNDDDDTDDVADNDDCNIKYERLTPPNKNLITDNAVNFTLSLEVGCLTSPSQHLINLNKMLKSTGVITGKFLTAEEIEDKLKIAQERRSTFEANKLVEWQKVFNNKRQIDENQLLDDKFKEIDHSLMEGITTTTTTTKKDEIRVDKNDETITKLAEKMQIHAENFEKKRKTTFDQQSEYEKHFVETTIRGAQNFCQTNLNQMVYRFREHNCKISEYNNPPNEVAPFQGNEQQKAGKADLKKKQHKKTD